MEDKNTNENVEYTDYNEGALWIGFLITVVLITAVFCVIAHFLFN